MFSNCSEGQLIPKLINLRVKKQRDINWKCCDIPETFFQLNVMEARDVDVKFTDDCAPIQFFIIFSLSMAWLVHFMSTQIRTSSLSGLGADTAGLTHVVGPETKEGAHWFS